MLHTSTGHQGLQAAQPALLTWTHGGKLKVKYWQFACCEGGMDMMYRSPHDLQNIAVECASNFCNVPGKFCVSWNELMLFAALSASPPPPWGHLQP